jgi:Uma2 family endonuclease
MLSLLQAKAQAWCVAMLSALNDVYDLGVVVGKGTTIQHNSQTLYPDVMFVPNEMSEAIGEDAVGGPVALAIDLIPSAMPPPPRQELQKNYAAAGILEYWQVEVDTDKAFIFQLNAAGGYDLVKPDRKKIHHSIAAEELFFPIAWLQDQPGIMEMLEFWDVISG